MYHSTEWLPTKKMALNLYAAPDILIEPVQNPPLLTPDSQLV